MSTGASASWRILVGYRLSGGENGLAFIIRLRRTLGREFAAVLMTAETDEEIFEQAERGKIAMLRKPIKLIRFAGGS